MKKRRKEKQKTKQRETSNAVLSDLLVIQGRMIRKESTVLPQVFKEVEARSVGFWEFAKGPRQCFG